MSSNNVLKVKVDSTRGVCELIDAEGNVVATKDAKTYYSMEKVEEKRKALDVERSGRIPPEKLTFVDFLVYDILKEYDEEHQGSEYAKKYLETVTDQITYNIPASDEPLKDKLFRKLIGRTIETEATYLKRVRAIKTENLSKAGLSISYDDVATINTSSALTSEQRKVAIDIAKRQEKYNGIKTGELIEIPIIDDVPELSAEELEMQRAEAEKEALERQRADEARKAEEAEKARKEAEEAEAARKATEEAERLRLAEEAERAKQQPPKVEAPEQPAEEPKSEEEHTDDDDKGSSGSAGGAEDKAPKGEAPKEEPQTEKPHQNAPKPKSKKRKIDGIRAGREAYRQRLQAGKPKKVDRPEAKRETKSERKARLAREAYEQRKASASKKPTPKPVAPKTKTKEDVSSKVNAEHNKRVNIKQVRVQIDDAKVRFTRKLKDVTDSIRNKVYKPHRKGFKIAGVAALASLLLFAGVRTYNHFNDVEVRGVIADTTSLVQMLEGEKEIGSKDTIIRTATELSANFDEVQSKGSTPAGVAQTEANGGAQGVQTQGQAGTKTPAGSGVQSNAPASEEVKTEAQVKAEQEEASRDYLSSVRVGSTMKIDNGRYFEAPDGTGNYGHFENYQDCDKILTIIGVTTQDGYRAIRTDEMSVQDIMEKYPGAKLSYHFEAVNRETGHKTTLGWLTENSRQQTMENTRGQVQMEDRER